MTFESITIIDFLTQGGVVLLLLIGCSVISWAVIFERAVVFFSLRRQLKHFVHPFLECLKNKEKEEADSLLLTNDSKMLGQFFAAGMLRKGKSRVMVEEALLREGARLNLHLEHNLTILATLGSVTPFVGLFGTVVGIIKTFLGMSNLTSASSSVMVVNGIAEALVSTAAGLFVAIPAVMAFNFFVHRQQKMNRELEIATSEFVELIATEKSK